MMPRLACGPPSSEWVRVRSRKPRAASSACPALGASNAWSNCLRPAGLIPEGVSLARAPAAADGGGAAGADAAGGVCAGFGVPTPAQPATAAPRAPSAPQRQSRSTYRIDRDLAAFGLCIAHRPQLAQRHVALPDPLVVNAVGAVARVQLVQPDRLFLERVGLLLQQHVVLLEFVLRKPLRTLRGEQGPAEVVIQLSDPIGGLGRNIRHP